jgi:hypothetical protein
MPLVDHARYGVEAEFGFLPGFFYAGQATGSRRLLDCVPDGCTLTADWKALNVFFRTEMFLDGATPFREVRRFSPPPVIVEERAITRSAAVEGYSDLFRQSIARRITDDAILALSGGCDSRHILLELHAQGCLPRQALTVDLQSTNDLEIARQLAEAVGIGHVVMPADYSIEGARYTVDETGFMSTQHAWFSGVSRSRDRKPWWDGIAGDVLSAGLFMEEWNTRLFREHRLDELADRLVAHGPVPHFEDQSLFPRCDALHAIRGELERHVDAANPVGSYYFWNRTRVDIASAAFGLLRPAGQTILAPYLDRDLWGFLASLPSHHLIDHKFHEDTLRTAYPRFAHVSFAHKRPVPVVVYRRRALGALRAPASKALTKAGGKTMARLVRSLILTSRARDVDWIVSSWVYRDSLERALSAPGTRRLRVPALLRQGPKR